MRDFDVWQIVHVSTNEWWLLVINMVWYIPIASRVVERPKTSDLKKLGNIKKLSKLHELKPVAQSCS